MKSMLILSAVVGLLCMAMIALELTLNPHPRAWIIAVNGVAVVLNGITFKTNWRLLRLKRERRAAGYI